MERVPFFMSWSTKYLRLRFSFRKVPALCEQFEKMLSGYKTSGFPSLDEADTSRGDAERNLYKKFL